VTARRPCFFDAIQDARAEGSPLLAFNVVDLASLFGVMEAARDIRRPVIVQVSARTLEYYGAALLRRVVNETMTRSGAVCFLHLDHARDELIIQQAIEARLDGFMIDASYTPFEENVRITRRWVQRGHAAGMVVEGELGGIRGMEDGVSAGQALPALEPESCIRFHARTQVDLLGTDIGTAHGLYERPPVIDFNLVELLGARIPGRLVVHGGSGLDGTTLKRLVSHGVGKINFSTDLKVAWANAVQEGIKGGVPEPLAGLQRARSAVAAVVRDKFGLIGG
jgi:ketose-bisphosphate aldolase